jgi:hypothetical protein
MRLALTAILGVFLLILGACYELEEDENDIQGRLLRFPEKSGTELILDEKEWFNILDKVTNANNFVTLDLKDCKAPTDGENEFLGGLYKDPVTDEIVFNPKYTTKQKKDRILKIILPDAATMIISAVEDETDIDDTDIDNSEKIKKQSDQSAFAHFTSLRSISAENVAIIGNYAFYGLHNLNNLDFPSAKDIRPYAFKGCTSLTSVLFTQVIDIGKFSFKDCTKLSRLIFPVAETIGMNAFKNCTSLTAVRFEKATDVKKFAFLSCRNLKRATFDLGVGGATIIVDDDAFTDCHKDIKIEKEPPAP